MVKGLAFAAALVLSGCGVDGPPEAPRAGPAPGVSISGDATMGVIFTP
ncbi:MULTISPECIES: hypothetical protein [unclassified Paracoccus (in: a-proteobacteria)]|nr:MULTISPECIES: hypothetical protein [unclassified Paracoccus (in: a-proteobacteria)]MBB1490700.1 hypothetical protein [Paracoccus sp. MC1854]MBB1497457.1 hypothetical protein [Paracoccus sp. MC1862]QQO45936.1 hypothetical protein JGR78_06490 [Paracoccus sp. MC1862]